VGREERQGDEEEQRGTDEPATRKRSLGQDTYTIGRVVQDLVEDRIARKSNAAWADSAVVQSKARIVPALPDDAVGGQSGVGTSANAGRVPDKSPDHGLANKSFGPRDDTKAKGESFYNDFLKKTPSRRSRSSPGREDPTGCARYART
jgi:hypothetical protein